MKDEKTGDDLVSIGFVVDLEYADATTSAHDLLQLFKLHPLVKKILEGGERVAWGAKALPGGGYWSMPKLTMPGALLVGDAAGMVDTVALKGVHHCDQVGHARRRGDLRGAQARAAVDFEAYEDGRRGVVDRQGALRGPQHAPAVPEGLPRGRPARQPDDRHEGQAPRRPLAVAPQRRAADVRRQHARTAIRSPTASTRSTSSRRSSSRATRPATTRRTTSACRRTSRARSPRRGAGCARPASTRSPTTRPRRATST